MLEEHLSEQHVMKLPTVKTDIQLRYSDLDVLGHVSNSIYSQYFELGRLGWLEALNGEQPVTVIANTHIDFIKEIGLKDKVHVLTSCVKKGTKSLTLSQDIYSNNELATKSTIVLVGFDLETRKSCVLLDGWEAS